MKQYFRLAKLLKPYRHLLLIAVILVILYSLSNAASIYLSIPLLKTLFTNTPTDISILPAKNFFDSLRQVLDSYIFSGGDKYNSLIKVCILLFSAYLLKNIFAFMQSTLTQYVEKKLVTDIRRRMFHKFNSLSLKYFNQRRSGDIVSRFISDVNAIQNTVYITFTDLIKQPIMIITFLLMAFFISWKLTLISMISVPVSVILIAFLGKKLKKYGIRVQESLGEFTSVISENIYGGKIIRAFSMERFENRRFERKLVDYFRSLMKGAIYSNLNRPLTEVVSVALGVFIIWYAGKEIFSGSSLAPEEFIGFLLIIFQLMAPIKDLGAVVNKMQESHGPANRIFEILDAKPEIFDTEDSVVKQNFESKIEFRDVGFTYDTDDRMILEDIDLKINKNENIAIVGLSGAGKSTMVDLLPRFYDVSKGGIYIDGVNIKNLKLDSLRKMFGIVTQEIILFNDTIRNNIAYGREDIPMEKIIKAAKSANAHDFILETERGYDTEIGERGLRLSGGQKQRIAIARALLKNAPIMILDEATSSLDSESENLIQEAIERLMMNRTSIVIAHRLSTIRNADRIVVIDDGRISVVGTHEELMESKDGIYSKLYEMQFG
ncbi:MAG: ABC transporter ATP-binding protein/permease [Ignavibacteria bacterium]|nr:ABC transporter ATP-binding protein/permease [Ignavibacteria bacterium]